MNLNFLFIWSLGFPISRAILVKSVPFSLTMSYNRRSSFLVQEAIDLPLPFLDPSTSFCSSSTMRLIVDFPLSDLSLVLVSRSEFSSRKSKWSHLCWCPSQATRPTRPWRLRNNVAQQKGFYRIILRLRLLEHFCFRVHCWFSNYPTRTNIIKELEFKQYL